MTLHLLRGAAEATWSSSSIEMKKMSTSSAGDQVNMVTVSAQIFFLLRKKRAAPIENRVNPDFVINAI
jgi:hypothetical protein